MNDINSIFNYLESIRQFLSEIKVDFQIEEKIRKERSGIYNRTKFRIENINDYFMHIRPLIMKINQDNGIDKKNFKITIKRINDIEKNLLELNSLIYNLLINENYSIFNKINDLLIEIKVRLNALTTNISKIFNNLNKSKEEEFKSLYNNFKLMFDDFLGEIMEQDYLVRDLHSDISKMRKFLDKLKNFDFKLNELDLFEDYLLNYSRNTISRGDYYLLKEEIKLKGELLLKKLV